MRILLFLLGLLTMGGAWAEPDTFGLGTGKDGLLLVDSQDMVINRYGQLIANAAVGTQDLTISNTSAFAPGELVLVYQSAGLMPAPDSGVQRAISLGSTPVGQFEYARVEALADSTLRLKAPLQYGYAAGVTQVVSVPEYTDVQVLSNASLTALPWDGKAGGILALLATGTLTLSGSITVDGAGFRGGDFVHHESLNGCTSFDQAAGSGGSYKGEGVVAGRFGSAAGRGNLANGGGSGICHNSGGAGGGHIGLGGNGGYTGPSDGARDVGGLGGAPLRYVPYERLALGGGGGGGSGHMDVGTEGAAGGGVVIIRAREVVGTGMFSAMGDSADSVPTSSDDGAGGGGAGGAISVRVAGALMCGRAQAAGGKGGSTLHPNLASGPGGGGGGGMVFLQGESITCPVSVLAGAPGQATAAGNSFGAGPSTTDGGTSYGSEQTFELSFRVPATPVLTQPPNGATGVAPRPRIQGTAEPGVLVHLFLDGRKYVQVVPDETGAFSYNVISDLTEGPHELTASAEEFGSYSPQSAPNRFDVVGLQGDGGTPDAGADGGIPDAGGDGGIPDAGLSVREPVLVTPAEGERVNPTPLFAGTSRTGVSVSIEVDGAEVARVTLDEQQRFRYTLTPEQKLAPGEHNVVVRAWDQDGNAGLSSTPTRFEVKAPEALEVGCGCGASPGAGLGTLALLLGLGAARLRRRG